MWFHTDFMMFFPALQCQLAIRTEVMPSYDNNARMQMFIRALHIGFACEGKEENLARGFQKDGNTRKLRAARPVWTDL